MIVSAVNDTGCPVSGKLCIEFHRFSSGTVTQVLENQLDIPVERAVCAAEVPLSGTPETEGFFRIVFDGSGHHVEKEFFTVEYTRLSRYQDDNLDGDLPRQRGQNEN